MLWKEKNDINCLLSCVSLVTFPLFPVPLPLPVPLSLQDLLQVSSGVTDPSVAVLRREDSHLEADVSAR